MSDSKQSRHPVRVRNVRILRRVASEHGVAAVPDNAARKRVEKLGEDLLAVQLEGVGCSGCTPGFEGLPGYVQDCRSLWGGRGTKKSREVRSRRKSAGVESSQLCSSLTMVLMAASWQQTSGSSRTCFLRFTAFLNGLKLVLHAVGISATMERASVERVHLHAYLHLSKPFRKSGREALAAFVFEGIRPHVETNRAHCNAFQGAVKFGHFYVFCDKKGSLCLG